MRIVEFTVGDKLSLLHEPEVSLPWCVERPPELNFTSGEKWTRLLCIAYLSDTPRSSALLLAALSSSRFAFTASALGLVKDNLGDRIALPSPESMDETESGEERFSLDVNFGLAVSSKELPMASAPETVRSFRGTNWTTRLYSEPCIDRGISFGLRILPGNLISLDENEWLNNGDVRWSERERFVETPTEEFKLASVTCEKIGLTSSETTSSVAFLEAEREFSESGERSECPEYPTRTLFVFSLEREFFEGVWV